MAQRRSGREEGEGGLLERVVKIRRVSKTVAGGRRFSFSAAVVVGDGQGHIGIGLGKAREVPEAIRKGVAIARRNLVTVPRQQDTIPHALWSKFKASRVLLKPAPPGTGVIAGGPIRAVMEAAGIRDIFTKSLGSRNPINVIMAAFQGLQQLRDPALERARRRAAAAQEAP